MTKEICHYLLFKTGIPSARLVDTPMNLNLKLLAEEGELLKGVGQYRKLIGKLINLTIIEPDISFAISVMS